MEKPRQFVKFKNSNNLPSITFMHPLMVMIMFDMANWCKERNIEFVVTSTLSTLKKDLKLGRTSNSHRKKRAFDLRSRTFSIQQEEDFIAHFNEKYRDVASISSSDLVPRLIVAHGEGAERHFHIAIHSRFSLNF